MAGIRYKGQIFSGAAAFGTADHVAYDNTESGLSATDVQGAVDELNSKITDYEEVNYSSLFKSNISDGQCKLVKIGRIGIFYFDFIINTSVPAATPLIEGLPRLIRSEQMSVVPYNQSGTTASSAVYEFGGKLLVYNQHQTGRYIFSMVTFIA